LYIILPSTLKLLWYFPSKIFPSSYSIITYPCNLLSFHSPFLIFAPGITFSSKLLDYCDELFGRDLCFFTIRSLSLELVKAFIFLSDFEYVFEALLRSFSILVLLFLGGLNSFKGSATESLKSKGF
jgi:hypothetical protein